MAWANSKLVKMSNAATNEVRYQDFEQLEIKDSIAAMEDDIRKYRETRATGSGNIGNGSDKSTNIQ